ncbi:MAG: hypothetical protein NTU74_09060, partial [Deltaproteobacteria bacterium]|nr:hypothetical protein [Deltaproteobacteria bacterium]
MKQFSFSALKTSYDRCIDWILQGKRQYFSCYLPRHISFIIYGFFKLFYSGIKIHEDQVKSLRQLPEDAVIVYVHKTKSYFEWLFYYTRFHQLNLKAPEIGCDYRIFFWQPLMRLVRILIFHLDYFFRHFSLPNPYDSGFIQDKLTTGTSALVPLVEDNGFYRRFVKSKTDPVRYLVEIQQTMKKPIVIVPLVMFFSNFPDRSTSPLL